MVVFNIVVEIPEPESDDDEGFDDQSYIHDMLQDIIVPIESAGYKYKLTTLS